MNWTWGAAAATALLLPMAAEMQERRYEPNVLEARTAVSAMAERALEMLEGEVALRGVEGWAVFSGDALGEQLPAGVGLAEHVTGESYYLRVEGDPCTADGERQVLVFRDRELFREFRQGQLSGRRLEQARSAGDGRLLAFRFAFEASPELRPLPLAACEFRLHDELQRALIADPSRTDELVDRDEPVRDDE